MELNTLHIKIFDKSGNEIVISDNFESNLYMEKVSSGLIATQTLFVCGNEGGVIDTLYNTYASVRNKKLLFYINAEEQKDETERFRFFTVKRDSDEVVWTNKILLDCTKEDDFVVRLGFSGEKEGEYTNNIHVFEIETEEGDLESIDFDSIPDDKIVPICRITVSSSTVGDDERYRHMFTNFGIPDPITYMDIFKDSKAFESRIDDDESEKNKYYREHPNYHKYDGKVDYDYLNKKSKELYLSYPEIFPYVGTYKALVNAVDFLGYDDIFFKEWYKELGDNKNLKPHYVTYEIPYKNGGKSILSTLTTEERIHLRKMNWLTMVYKITELALDENGEQKYYDIDENNRIPVIKNNYSDYESDEILVKLIALKNWLEKYIIGLNCRIIEINGEGIVVERYKGTSFGKVTTGLDYIDEFTLTPFCENKIDELEMENSMCSLRLGIYEQFDANGNPTTDFFDLDFSNPENKFTSITFKALLTTKNAAFSSYEKDGKKQGITDIPLLIQDGEIFFDSKNTFTRDRGSEANFITLPTIQIERARLRDCNRPWKTSVEFDIDYSGKEETPYKVSRNAKSVNDNDTDTFKKSYINLRPVYDNNGNCLSSLKYTTNNNFGIPMFIIKNFQDAELGSTYFDPDKEYILEIIDGKFIFNAEGDNDVYDTKKATYLNFNFDNNGMEQNIEVNYVYTKRVDLEEYAQNPKTYLTDMIVNNLGEYRILAYATDKYNSVYHTSIPKTIRVFGADPYVTLYTNEGSAHNEKDFFDKNPDGKEISYGGTAVELGKTLKELYDDNNQKCKMRETYLTHDVTVEDSNENGVSIKYATYPTMSYAIDTPKEDDVAHFLNITDKINMIGYYASSGGGDPKFNVTPTPENSRIKVYTDYTVIWFKMSEVFSSNTLNDGVHRDSTGKVDFPQINLSNFVVYDKIHAETVYQDYCIVNYAQNPDNLSEKACFIILDNSLMLELFTYYKELSMWKRFMYNSKKSVETTGASDDGYYAVMGEQYPFTEYPEYMIEQGYENGKYRVYKWVGGVQSYDTSVAINTGTTFYGEIEPETETSTYKYVRIKKQNPDGKEEKEEEYKEVTITDFILNKKAFEFFAQAVYEIPVSRVIHFVNDDGTIDRTHTIIEVENDYVPNLKELFEPKQKVKLSYLYNLDSENQLISQSTYTVLEISGRYITIDGFYTFKRKYDYSYYYHEIVGEIDNDKNRVIKVGNKKYYAPIRVHPYTTEYDADRQPIERDPSVVDSERKYYTDLYYEDELSEKDTALLRLIAVEKVDGEKEGLYISHAHCAFVDYELPVDWARENKNGYTELHVKDDRYLHYVDNTFSVMSKPFSMHVASSNWMSSFKEEDFTYPNISKYKIYEYGTPITVSNNSLTHIVIVPHTNHEKSDGTEYNTFIPNLENRHCFWKVYKFDKYKDKNVLQFESWNDVLFIEPSEEGNYTVELTIYDDFGNIISNKINGIFKVVNGWVSEYESSGNNFILGIGILGETPIYEMIRN